jgi:hypothetical protein
MIQAAAGQVLSSLLHSFKFETRATVTAEGLNLSIQPHPRCQSHRGRRRKVNAFFRGVHDEVQRIPF